MTEEQSLGKGPDDENFPVASVLIRRDLRPLIRSFYFFARAADDIADSTELSAAEKLARLNACERALNGDVHTGDQCLKAAVLAAKLSETAVGVRHAAQLVAAFRQDAVQERYRSWDDLVEYCRYSANPVGRYLLELHGECEGAAVQSDALCTALQVLNHLQDCGADYRDLNRVYLPLDWMNAAETGVEDLTMDAASPGLRRVLNQVLDKTEKLIEQARPMGRIVRDRRLAAEAAVICELARRLARRLRRQDPLAMRVSLSKFDFCCALAAGLIQALMPRVRGSV